MRSKMFAAFLNFNFSLFLVFIISIFAQTVSAQTTSFTYQGKLTDGGSALTAPYDLQFNLFATQTGGTPLNASPLILENVLVTNGIFTVQLDFGNLFDGANRFLEISVRPGASVGSFTVISPRQQITSSPYSVRSLNAETATNSTQLGGIAANQYVLTTDPRLDGSNYVQNTTTQQAGVNFNVGGTGTANILNAATQFNINGSRILSNPGGNNLFAGLGAGSNNSTGTFNAFFGLNTGNINTTANFNSFFGATAGSGTTTGGSNSFFGTSAGAFNTFGERNVAIGAFSDFGTNGLNNAIAIGYRSYVTQSNSLVLGGINGVNGATADTNVGIGTTAPTERLQVIGNALISGTGTANIFNATTQFNLNGNRILSNAGTSNLFAGVGAGASNTTGGANSFFGADTGNANTNGVGNSFFGNSAGMANTSGNFNSFFGSSAGLSNTTGDGNSFFGTGVGRNNTTGSSNSFFGNSAGGATSTGFSNSFFGSIAGFSNTTGFGNTFFGRLAGNTNTTGISNTIVGSEADVSLNNLSFATAIGSFARVSSNDTIVIGKVAGTYYSVLRPADTVIIPGNLNLLGNLTGSFTVPASSITGTLNTAQIPDLSASYIRNQTTQQTSSNFNVSGTGTANIFNAATQFNLNGSRILTNAGTNNLFAGIGAGQSGTGSNNSFFGFNAGFSNTGGFNAFFGTSAGSANTTGGGNAFFGRQAGFANTTASQNAFFGENSGISTTTGGGNTFVGRNAGDTNTTGSNNTILGAEADLGANNLSFATAIGSGAVVNTSNTLVLGRTADTVKVPGRLRASSDFTIGNDLYFDNAGKGLVLKTPNGAQCYYITINNSGTLISTLTSCVVFSPRPSNEEKSTVENQNGVSESENSNNSKSVASGFDVLKTQTENLQKENAELRLELQKQQAVIEALKKLFCVQNPLAEICKQ